MSRQASRLDTKKVVSNIPHIISFRFEIRVFEELSVLKFELNKKLREQSKTMQSMIL